MKRPYILFPYSAEESKGYNHEHYSSAYWYINPNKYRKTLVGHLPTNFPLCSVYFLMNGVHTRTSTYYLTSLQLSQCCYILFKHSARTSREHGKPLVNIHFRHFHAQVNKEKSRLADALALKKISKRTRRKMGVAQGFFAF